MRNAWMLSAVLLVLPAACGTEAANAAKECASRDLSNVCPAGTRPRVDAYAVSACAGAAEMQLISQSGGVAGACSSEGRCAVLCEVDPEFRCEFGIQSMSRDAVVCSERPTTAGCGNGVCDTGENGSNCPIDCSGVCVAGRERCNGPGREVCNLQGRWEALQCVSDERCVENNSRTTCVRSDFARASVQAPAPAPPPGTNTQTTRPATTQTTTQTATATRPATAQRTAVQATTFACASTFDCMRIAPGFLPDPISVRGRSGGNTRYAECPGYFAPANQPDHLIYLDAEFVYLKVGLIPGAPAGTSLLMASLDGAGSVFCSHGAGQLPVLERSFPRGTYGVWVGATTSTERELYSIYATELR